MNKIINIIIPTFNRPEYLENLLNGIYKTNRKESFRIYVVDDCSEKNYTLQIDKFIDNENFNYIKLIKNSGKNAAVYEALTNINSGEYAIVLDDKDCFEFSLDTVQTKFLENNQVVGFDLFDRNNTNFIIGEKLIDHVTVHDFYFKPKRIGDKRWIFKINQIDIENFKKFIVNNEFSYEDVLWTHFLWNSKIVEIISNNNVSSKYLDSGVTKNIALYQEQNPITYLYTLIIYFENLKSFVYRLWYYNLIKKQLSLLKKKKIKKNYFNFKFQTIYVLLWAPIKVFSLCKNLKIKNYL